MEDIVDQKKVMEDSCKSKCTKPYVDYQQCVKRVEGDNSGNKHCTGQYFDYWSCIDKCVSFVNVSNASIHAVYRYFRNVGCTKALSGAEVNGWFGHGPWAM